MRRLAGEDARRRVARRARQRCLAPVELDGTRRNARTRSLRRFGSRSRGRTPVPVAPGVSDHGAGEHLALAHHDRRPRSGRTRSSSAMPASCERTSTRTAAPTTTSTPWRTGGGPLSPVRREVDAYFRGTLRAFETPADLSAVGDGLPAAGAGDATGRSRTASSVPTATWRPPRAPPAPAARREARSRAARSSCSFRATGWSTPGGASAATAVTTTGGGSCCCSRELSPVLPCVREKVERMTVRRVSLATLALLLGAMSCTADPTGGPTWTLPSPPRWPAAGTTRALPSGSR